MSGLNSVINGYQDMAEVAVDKYLIPIILYLLADVAVGVQSAGCWKKYLFKNL